jgi:uncharacterized protein (DUF2267 family)
MTYAELVAEVQRWAAFEAPDDAERTIAVTARVLGERLLPEEAAAVAGALPEPVAGRLRGAAYQRDFDAGELYDRVARGEGVKSAFGMEHAQVACQVFGEALPEAVRLRLQKHLGEGLAWLFEPRAGGPPPPRPVHASPPVEPGQGSTLASGRPGSRHPLSEGHADRAQAGSVARSADPHGDTKLSSSRGLTQERLDESLAMGRPGPEHPVSDTKR